MPILEVVRAEACSQTLTEAAVPAYIRIVYGTRAVRLRFRVGGRIRGSVDNCMWCASLRRLFLLALARAAGRGGAIIRRGCAPSFLIVLFKEQVGTCRSDTIELW